MRRLNGYGIIMCLLLSAGCATTNHQAGSQKQELNFESTDSEAIQDGNQAARQGDWAAAAECWKEGQVSEDPTDQMAAWHNLGLYDESEGRLPDALAKYEKAQALSGDAKYASDIARVQARMDSAKKAGEPAVKPGETPVAEAPAAVPAAGDDLAAWKDTPGLTVVREKSIHRFNWTPVPNAAGYHVYTAKGKTFKQLNHKVLVKPQLRAVALPRGKVRVQVAALDAAGKEIARSKPVTLVMP